MKRARLALECKVMTIGTRNFGSDSSATECDHAPIHGQQKIPIFYPVLRRIASECIMVPRFERVLFHCVAWQPKRRDGSTVDRANALPRVPSDTPQQLGHESKPNLGLRLCVCLRDHLAAVRSEVQR